MTVREATASPAAAALALKAPAELARALETHFLSKLEYLNAIGIALSQVRDIDKLLETILIAAKNLTHADGGTLYRLVDGKLQFEIVRTDSLSIAMGGTSGNAVPFYPIPLQGPDGKPNYTMIAAYERVTIGDHTMFANGCFVGDASHRYDDPDMPITWQGFTSKGPVEIGDNCWFGVNCVVTSDVRVGPRCVVGANSVVNRDLPTRTIAAGAPAREIGEVEFATDR